MAMRKSRFFKYEYGDYDFHREDKPLIPQNIARDEQIEARNKIAEMKRKLEDIRDLREVMPEGTLMLFSLIPNYDGSHYSARVELNVPADKLREMKQFVKDYMDEVKGHTPFAPSIEDFILDFIDSKRMQLAAEISKIRKEMDKNRLIDVKVLGGSGVHRVVGRGEALACDCPQFQRNGECHHVELVKTLKQEGLLKDRHGEVKPPMVVIENGKGETEFDKENYKITIHREDENKTRTIRLLYHLGYGLGAMRQIGVVPRKMKWEQLQEILHEKSYEEVIHKEGEVEVHRGQVEMEI